MKLSRKILSILFVLVMALSIPMTAQAATIQSATIDYSKSGSFSLYKYDMTRAGNDGVWDTSSYVSTGVFDQSVNDILGDSSFTNNSGTNNLAYGYAVKGVEFKYLRLADITTYSREEANEKFVISVLYGFERCDRTTAFFEALGLSYNDNYYAADGIYYFTSDTINLALSRSLLDNSTALKNAMERLAADYEGTAMPETDEYGYSSVSGVPLGLYMVVETKVPDMVTSTCNPFIISLPMTTVDGSEWNYDVTVYPKNATGMPDLEKTVRESKADTGKNEGKTDDILDGYEHIATASAGDKVEYQFLSHLPTITSDATRLTCYSFEDHLSSGIEYNKGDVKLEFYRDGRCEDLIASWSENDGFFLVSYPDNVTEKDTEYNSSMLVELTGAGLEEINSSESVYSADSIYRGFSECYMRITYSCTIQSDDTVTCGDEGNPNTVKLTWRRTSSDYYDVLEDEASVFTYAIDLTKKFSDGAGKYENVRFIVKNSSDNYYIKAENKDGIYYVTGHTADAEKGTVFTPDKTGHIFIKGVEDDTYIATELETDEGYTLLRDSITIVIKAEPMVEVRGKVPLLSAGAEVNGEDVNMLPDKDSSNAVVPLTVMNTRGFDLPRTGSRGIWMYSVFGAAAMCAAAAAILLMVRKKDPTE